MRSDAANVKRPSYMRELCKHVRYDIFYGLGKNIWKLIPFVVVQAILCYIYMNGARVTVDMGLMTSMPNAVDIWMDLFMGMREYNPKLSIPFSIPPAWLVMQVYIPLAISGYAQSDMNDFGMQNLIRTTHKSCWFLGKIIYSAVFVILAYLATAAVVTVYAFVFGEVGFTVNHEVSWAMAGLRTEYISKYYMVAFLLILPFLTSVIMSVLHTMVSFVMKPAFSLVINVAYTVFSAYYTTYFLIGNYSMLLRSKAVLGDGIDPTVAITVDLIIIPISIIIGCLFFKKIDFIKK